MAAFKKPKYKAAAVAKHKEKAQAVSELHCRAERALDTGSARQV